MIEDQEHNQRKIPILNYDCWAILNSYLKDQAMNVPTEIEKVIITTADNIDLIAWFYNKD